MKLAGGSSPLGRAHAFSALGRAVWDETGCQRAGECISCCAFSALGRAVWDETVTTFDEHLANYFLSVLSVEPYGMKPKIASDKRNSFIAFSALGRAVWDETRACC